MCDEPSFLPLVSERQHRTLQPRCLGLGEKIYSNIPRKWALMKGNKSQIWRRKWNAWRDFRGLQTTIVRRGADQSLFHYIAPTQLLRRNAILKETTKKSRHRASKLNFYATILTEGLCFCCFSPWQKSMGDLMNDAPTGQAHTHTETETETETETHTHTHRGEEEE